MNLGEISLAIDLGKATEVSLDDAQKSVASVSYKAVVKSGNRVVGEAAGAIALEGAADAAKPAAPAGPPGATPLEGDRVVRNLPAPVDDVVPGGSARYLILHLGKLRKLAFFDVVEGKIVNYLSLPSDDIVYAAGADKLVIATRDQNILQRYDLQTLKKELTVPLQDVGQVLAIGMGCASAGPAMLLTTNGVRFVDVAKLAPVNVKGDEAGAIAVRNLPVQNQAQVRASADGTLFVMGGANGCLAWSSWKAIR